MKKQLETQNKKIEYFLRRSLGSQKLRLAIYQGGNFIVTAPKKLSFLKIENYLQEKIEWILEKLKLAKKQRKNSVFWKRDAREYEEFKNKALEKVSQKVEKYAKLYNFQYNKIRIRNQKTRWGSCSQKGNLNYNYKIIFLSEQLADYIIIHELCHLKELNHSRSFWRLVEQIIPDYQERIKKLKKL